MSTFDPQKPLSVSVKRAMEITGLRTTTIYALIGQGKLESTKVGGKRLIRYDSIEKLVAATPHQPISRKKKGCPVGAAL
jgi:excisionase family DNA binding protein